MSTKRGGRQARWPWVLYHYENGDYAGGSVRSLAEGCGKLNGRRQPCHVFPWAADGTLCECGALRRRVFDQCPTCRRDQYVTVERVEPNHTGLSRG